MAVDFNGYYTQGSASTSGDYIGYCFLDYANNKFYLNKIDINGTAIPTSLINLPATISLIPAFNTDSTALCIFVTTSAGLFVGDKVEWNISITNSVGTIVAGVEINIAIRSAINTDQIKQFAISSPSVGQALIWNGTAWQNQAVPSGGSQSMIFTYNTNQQLGYSITNTLSPLMFNNLLNGASNEFTSTINDAGSTSFTYTGATTKTFIFTLRLSLNSTTGTASKTILIRGGVNQSFFANGVLQLVNNNVETPFMLNGFMVMNTGDKVRVWMSTQDPLQPINIDLLVVNMWITQAF